VVVAYIIQPLLVYDEVVHMLLVEIFFFFRVEIVFLLVVGDLVGIFLDY
jgi:hypothetical protein